MNSFQLLNGLTFAALLFVVASGFTLIFGLLRIVNLAHGALYLFGGYIGFAVATKTGSFLLGGVSAMAAIAAIGFVLDQGLLRFVRGNDLRQVLLTDEIPDPRDVVLICLIDACGLLGLVMTPDEIAVTKTRVEQLSRLDLIGQAVTKAVAEIRFIVRHTTSALY